MPRENKSFKTPTNPIVNGVYAHYKNGDEYLVRGISLNTDTKKWCVEYSPLYEGAVAEKLNREFSLWFAPAKKDGVKVERYKFLRMNA